jgi:hypothetical protein
MQTYMHVIPGMDAAAAKEVANLILGEALPDVAAQDPGGPSGMDAILDAGGQE